MANFAPHLHRLPGQAGGATQSLPHRAFVELDYSHPMANGLVAMFAPGMTANDLAFPTANPPLGLANANLNNMTPFGPGWMSIPGDAGGNPYAQLVSTPPARWRSQNLTMIWFGKTLSSGGNQDAVIMNYGANGNPYIRAGFMFAANQGMQVLINTSYSGVFGGFNSTIVAANLVNYGQICAVYRNGQQLAYLNGVNIASGGDSGFINFQNDDIFLFGDGRNGPGISTLYGMIYTRALNPNEVISLYNDPFQMLRPIANTIHRVHVPSVAAPSGKRPRITVFA